MAIPICGLRNIAFTGETVEPCITIETKIVNAASRFGFLGSCIVTDVGTGTGFTVDWGDGTVDNLSQHRYSTTGIFTIRILGNLTGILSGTSASNCVFTYDNYAKADTLGEIQRITIDSPVSMDVGYYIVQNSNSFSNLKEVVFGPHVANVGVGSNNPVVSNPVNVRFLGKTSLRKDAFFVGSGQKSYMTSVPFIQGRTSILDFEYGCNAAATTRHNFGSVTIQNGVKTIGQSAFLNCTIASLELPASLTSISFYAFSNAALNTIRCYATTAPTFESSAFTGTSRTIYVPAGSLSSYALWNNIGTVVAM